MYCNSQSVNPTLYEAWDIGSRRAMKPLQIKGNMNIRICTVTKTITNLDTGKVIFRCGSLAGIAILPQKFLNGSQLKAFINDSTDFVLSSPQIKKLKDLI